ncbi:GumC family protein [Anabaena azotica]|uniref:non-specific protein-tyrosine kinase n=1 Tax=Anabaena azotica FACHB-119 TaxID=947527 RepID=A0ABR8D5V5_9NOST|nr:polysaccharide biosynthesis tyrosine autokinase [Anabaena azotica]MBD2501531.1 polysaccharide biosynthesis tyrosine autokinase [Anabaena azotica FACHB-119]
MENNSYKSTQGVNTERKGNSQAPLFQPQPFSVPDTQEEESGLNVAKVVSLLQRRALVIAGVSLIATLAIAVHSTLNPKPTVYESNFRLLVEPVNEDSKAVTVVNEPNPVQSTLDYETQIQILKSPELMRSVVLELQKKYPDINYNVLLLSLTVQRVGETKIIEVRYSSQDPDQVKAVLDRIAKEYIEYSQERRQTKLRQGIRFIARELPSLQNRVDQIQKELQILKQKFNLNDPESLASQINNQTLELSSRRQEFDLQLAQARKNLAILKGKDGETVGLSDAQTYQQLLAQVRQLDVQIAAALNLLQEENPTVQTLKERRAYLLQLLHQEAQQQMQEKIGLAEVQLQRLEVANKELMKNEQLLEQKRRQLPVFTRQYTELQRRLQVATESLNRFLSTRENLKIRISQTELGWQLLEAPLRPQLAANSSYSIRGFLTSLVGSIALGVVTAFLLDKIDSTYHNVQALKADIKLPLIGNIPFEEQLDSSQSLNYQRWLLNLIPKVRRSPDKSEETGEYSTKFLEALRVLYTNLQLLNSDGAIRSLVISSATEGDGKSTVAFHLAIIAATMGQRVLIVDADLRQPTIHKLANVSTECGLSNLISSNLSVDEVTTQAPDITQLNIIAAGSIPPDPAKLLSSEKMKRLMQEFSQRFDLVIYDVPPFLGLADASLIAPSTDGVLMVVKIDKTDSSVLKAAIDDLKLLPVNILGVVGNAQKSRYGDY